MNFDFCMVVVECSDHWIGDLHELVKEAAKDAYYLQKHQMYFKIFLSLFKQSNPFSDCHTCMMTKMLF